MADRSKTGYAVVAKGGVIDLDTVRSRKRDVSMTIYDEETGAKIKRVRVTVVEKS